MWSSLQLRPGAFSPFPPLFLRHETVVVAFPRDSFVCAATSLSVGCAAIVLQQYHTREVLLSAVVFNVRIAHIGVLAQGCAFESRRTSRFGFTQHRTYRGLRTGVCVVS